MVGTVGAARKLGGRAALVGTISAFTAGLAAGSAAVFGGLGLIGAALEPGRTVLVVVALLAAAAAVGDARGVRVRPQIRFQVPERWRGTMPLPVAVLLYGLLLGTGLMTYVPAVATWALVAFAVSLGNAGAALLVGLCFAAGRALPVAVLASAGEERLAERPAALRVVRTLAAVSLAVGAAALLASSAGAAIVVAPVAGDPSVAGSDLAWEQPGVGGLLRTGGQDVQLPGHEPAIGGALIAWRNGDAVTVATRATFASIFEETIVGARHLALSDRWLAFTRTGDHGVTRLTVQSLADTSQTATVESIASPAQIGRPSIDGDMLVFHVATRRASWIEAVDLATGKRSRLRGSRTAQLLNPVVTGSGLLYVRVSRCAQELRLGGLAGGSERVLLSLPPLAGQDLGHEAHHTKQGEHLPCGGNPRPTTTMLWTTALTSSFAYVTTLRPAGKGGTTPTLLQIPR